MIKGLKNFFKEEQLSDRRLKIIEIEENLFSGINKRKWGQDQDEISKPAIYSCKRFKPDSSNNETLLSNSSLPSTSKNNTTFSEDTLSNIINIEEDIKTNSSTAIVSDTSHNDDECTSSSTFIEVEAIVNVTPNNQHQIQHSSPNGSEDCTLSNAKPSLKLVSDENDNTDVITVEDDDETCPDSSCNEIDFNSNGAVYSEFPVHSIVLCINSNFFKKLLVDSGMKETKLNTVEVKVGYGEGKYLELLIEAFYNEDILKTLKLSELLSILDIAARFSCTVFIQQGLELLNDKQIKSVPECDSILQHISRVFEIFDVDKRYETLKASCIKFLSKKLFPLELQFDQQDIFRSLNFTTVTYMTSSTHAFVLSENHVFLFLYQWLLHNKEHQTSGVIKALISSIRFESLTVNFICDELTICDQILNIWKGYTEWFTRVLKYHALTPTTRCLRGIKNSPVTVRSVPSVQHTLEVVRKFSFKNGYFDDTTKNQIIWSSTCIIPTLSCKEMLGAFYIRMKLLSQNIFTPTEAISNFYRKFDLFYCLLPGNVIFDMKMLQHKKFLQRYVRKGEVIFKNKPICNLHVVASTDEEFVKKLKLHGINLILFFKTSPYSWLQMDMHNVKPNRKIIHLRGDKSFAVYTE